MTYRSSDWLRLFLAAVAAALVTMLGAGTASAATATVAETRVGASTPAAAHVVGPHECVSAGQRWGHAPPQARSVVGCCVATKTADEAVDAYTHGYKYHPRIRQRGLEDPRGHNFPYSFKTLTKDGVSYRIDVENPAPGVRPGQLHFQQGDAKYLYDFEREAFVGMPNSLQKVIARDPDAIRAIQTGRSYLGLE